ncbi:plasmolipin [Clupea harengus]|uniref:Plasmolipin n=1 Tax=Clupea harengus TaxID=7950 RepID=A0A6P3VL80_CLUHA|nr:plasmolipin [Clupea harengus]
MADFPGQVNTQTSSQQGNSHLGNMAMDVSFIKTIPAILMLVEIGVGLLVWSLIASAHFYFHPAVGWVMFVAVTLWLLTIVLFFMLFFGLHHRLSSVPWPLALMVYYAVATFLYLTAFITNAAVASSYYYTFFYGHMAAAAFFGCVVTLTYGASTFFAFMSWKGDGGGNAAGSTVPV